MQTTIYSLVSVGLVSLISFVGVLTLISRFKPGSKFLAFLVSFAAGALLGDVFVHILPELAEEGKFDLSVSGYILAAIAILFVIEKYIHWHHHGTQDDQSKHAAPFVFTNLIGDGLHNMIDGMVIAGAYLLDFNLGIVTTLAVILHEIPQEFADFGVLVYGGLSVRKALFYNFLSAFAAMFGAIIVLAFNTGDNLATILAALGAGSFIYLAIADLIPEIHKEKGQLTQVVSFGLGIAVMFALLLLE